MHFEIWNPLGLWKGLSHSQTLEEHWSKLVVLSIKHLVYSAHSGVEMQFFAAWLDFWSFWQLLLNYLETESFQGIGVPGNRDTSAVLPL